MVCGRSENGSKAKLVLSPERSLITTGPKVESSTLQAYLVSMLFFAQRDGVILAYSRSASFGVITTIEGLRMEKVSRREDDWSTTSKYTDWLLD